MRSFDLVDFKTLEAEFFLKKIISESPDPITARYYFSAYASASRSITFSLQAVMKGVLNFEEWYQLKQIDLKKDKLAKFFVEARNTSQKVGVVPINRGTIDYDENNKIEITYFFERKHPDFKELPKTDVTTACKNNLKTLLKIIYDCYLDFGHIIDPLQYYTKANFEFLNLTIDDADEEAIGVRGSSYVEGWHEEYRWQALRKSVPGCRLDLLFEKYLNSEKPYPPKLPKTNEEYDGVQWVPPSLKS